MDLSSNPLSEYYPPPVDSLLLRYIAKQYPTLSAKSKVEIVPPRPFREIIDAKGYPRTLPLDTFLMQYSHRTGEIETARVYAGYDKSTDTLHLCPVPAQTQSG